MHSIHKFAANGLSLLAMVLLVGLSSCHKFHSLHKAAYYSKMNKENASKEGYHANEANRLIDYKEKNKAGIEKEGKLKQVKIKDNLNKLNQPTKYQSKVPKTKKKFLFYM